MRNHGCFFFFSGSSQTSFVNLKVLSLLFFYSPGFLARVAGCLIQPIINFDPNEGADWLNFRERSQSQTLA